MLRLTSRSPLGSGLLLTPCRPVASFRSSVIVAALLLMVAGTGCWEQVSPEWFPQMAVLEMVGPAPKPMIVIIALPWVALFRAKKQPSMVCSGGVVEGNRRAPPTWE